MARYIMASRRAGKFRSADKRQARAAIENTVSTFTAGISVNYDQPPKDDEARRFVRFEADPGEVDAMRSSMPLDVIVEPEILHTFEDSHLPAEFLGSAAQLLSDPFPTGSGNTLRLRIRGANRGLRGAEVIAFFRGSGGIQTRDSARTPTGGRVTFTFSSFWTPVAVIVVPAGNFWSIIVRGPVDNATIDCPALPATGPIEWWHETMNIDRFSARRGSPVRVGVIDTGVGPHAHLGHVHDVGSFINNVHDSTGGQDVDAHGTHVCGTIGARPGRGAGAKFAGIAPGATLFSARVFPEGQGADQGDIADAIDHLSRDHQVDLINMSLGASTASQIELDAIRDAAERGTLCICAAGNSSGPVEFPAAFPETVAVSALGQLGWGPHGSIASTRIPIEPDRFGDESLYLANFSCFGDKVTCSGPGVGIISTVPERFGLRAPYGSMGGTSMASPAGCATLAALLAQSREFQARPRNQTRTALGLRILRDSCFDIGMSASFQGLGVPIVD